MCVLSRSPACCISNFAHLVAAVPKKLTLETRMTTKGQGGHETGQFDRYIEKDIDIALQEKQGEDPTFTSVERNWEFDPPQRTMLSRLSMATPDPRWKCEMTLLGATLNLEPKSDRLLTLLKTFGKSG